MTSSSSSESKNRDWSREVVGEIEILISVLFFGVSFIFQRYAMLQGLGPITYNACRYTVSTSLLIIFGPKASTMIHSEMEVDEDLALSEEQRKDAYWKDLWWWGVLCGLAAFGGSMLQQIGLVYLTAGKTGFITGMFVVVVPIVEWITPGFGAQLNYKSWIAAFGSLFGLYLLSGCTQSDDCLNGATGHGEIIVFISMLFWTLGIMWSDIGCKKVNVISLTTVDFATTTVLTIISAYIYEPQYLQYPYTSIRANWVPIVVVGFTEALAFCLSTLGQMYTPPSRASILFSLEAVSCAILGFFFLNERLSYVEMVGALFMAGSGFLADSSADEANEVEEHHKHLTNDVESAENGVDARSAVAKVEVELPLWRDHKSFGSMSETQPQNVNGTTVNGNGGQRSSSYGSSNRNGYVQVAGNEN